MATVKRSRCYGTPWGEVPSIYSRAMIYSCITTDLVEIFLPFQFSFSLFFKDQKNSISPFDLVHRNLRILVKTFFKNRSWMNRSDKVCEKLIKFPPFYFEKSSEDKFDSLINSFIRNSSSYLFTIFKIEDFNQKFLIYAFYRHQK